MLGTARFACQAMDVNQADAFHVRKAGIPEARPKVTEGSAWTLPRRTLDERRW